MKCVVKVKHKPPFVLPKVKHSGEISPIVTSPVGFPAGVKSQLKAVHVCLQDYKRFSSREKLAATAGSRVGSTS